jgi:hypothetical protein
VNVRWRSFPTPLRAGAAAFGLLVAGGLGGLILREPPPSAVIAGDASTTVALYAGPTYRDHQHLAGHLRSAHSHDHDQSAAPYIRSTRARHRLHGRPRASYTMRQLLRASLR